MKANVGLADRNVRIIVGVLLVGSNLFNYYVLGKSVLSLGKPGLDSSFKPDFFVGAPFILY